MGIYFSRDTASLLIILYLILIIVAPIYLSFRYKKWKKWAMKIADGTDPKSSPTTGIVI